MGSNSTQCWIKSLLLLEGDRKCLDSGSWQSDSHIYATSKLLKKQYPLQNGLQSTILLVGKLKWKSSNADYDSLLLKYPSSLTTQVAAITQLYFTMHHVNVQMQSGASDCGLFAIAVATVFDQKKMTMHLQSCFENGKMSNFPACSRLRRCTNIIKCTKKVNCTQITMDKGPYIVW